MASLVDVGGLPNHVKYCVSVLSLQWANIRTSPVGIPYNWWSEFRTEIYRNETSSFLACAIPIKKLVSKEKSAEPLILQD